MCIGLPGWYTSTLFWLLLNVLWLHPAFRARCARYCPFVPQFFQGHLHLVGRVVTCSASQPVRWQTVLSCVRASGIATRRAQSEEDWLFTGPSMQPGSQPVARPAAPRPPQPSGPRPYNTARNYPTVGQLRPPPQTWTPWDVSEDVVRPKSSHTMLSWIMSK